MPDYLDRADESDVLRLIVDYFEADPMSQTCFDSRLVERAKALVHARRQHKTTAQPRMAVTQDFVHS